MIQEDYVSFELAKLLKEKGFPQIKVDSSWFNQPGDHSDAYCTDEGLISRPTLSLVQKWLRKEKNIHVVPYIIEDSTENLYSVNVYHPYHHGMVDVEGTYEKALEIGIRKALELI